MQLVVDGVVVNRTVESGIIEGERVELASGVGAGDCLIASEEVYAEGQAVNARVIEDSQADTPAAN